MLSEDESILRPEITACHTKSGVGRSLASNWGSLKFRRLQIYSKILNVTVPQQNLPVKVNSASNNDDWEKKQQQAWKGAILTIMARKNTTNEDSF